jgi:hypothetical protein
VNVALLLIPLVSLAFGADAQTSSYDRAHREAHLTASLGELKRSSPQAIENLSQYFNMVSRTVCRSDDEALMRTCLEEQARRNCSKKSASCREISDVIIVNKLNEKKFVSPEERFRLMQKAGGSFGTAYSQLLWRKYAFLATELMLFPGAGCTDDGPACLGRAIDEYCLANADPKSIPWQACASAVVWFIGSSR